MIIIISVDGTDVYIIYYIIKMGKAAVFLPIHRIATKFFRHFKNDLVVVEDLPFLSVVIEVGQINRTLLGFFVHNAS